MYYNLSQLIKRSSSFKLIKLATFRSDMQYLVSQPIIVDLQMYALHTRTVVFGEKTLNFFLIF